MNQIEIIIIGKNSYHKTIKTMKTQLTYENKFYSITIDQDKLYLEKKNIIKRVYHRLFHGIHRFYRYYIIDAHETTDKEGEVTKHLAKVITPGSWQSDEAPAKLIQIADKTNVINKAITEIFGRPVSGRTILYIFIVGIVALVLYMVASGSITLPVTL